MRERPILFSAPMVRALLAGTKTQTRRPLRVQPPRGTLQVSTWHHPDDRPHFYAWVREEAANPSQVFGGAQISDWDAVPCPYGQPGDRLWVREAFSGPHHQERHPPRDWHSTDEIHYWADGCPNCGDWTKPRPGMFMPRWASRITLEVTGVRVERLQDISKADAQAEGAPFYEEGVDAPPSDPSEEWSYRASFRRLWESINGPESWHANPWVWVVEFRRLA